MKRAPISKVVKHRPKRTAAPEIPSGLSEAWVDVTKTLSDLCLEFAITNAQIRAIQREHGWPERPRVRMEANIKRCPDPTEQEIQQRIAQVRNGWTEEVRLSRYQGPKRVEYKAPEYSLDELRSQALQD